MEHSSESIVFSLIHTWMVLDLQITDQMIRETSQKIRSSENMGFFQGIKQDFTNSSASKKQDELFTCRNQIFDNLTNFRKQYHTFFLHDKDLKKILQNANILSRKMMLVPVLMRREISFANRAQILEIVSTSLFKDPVFLKNLDNRITSTYQALLSAPTSAPSRSTNAALISSILTFALPVLAIGTTGDIFGFMGPGASAPQSTHLLKRWGFGDMQTGVGVLSLASAALGQYTYSKLSSTQQEEIANGFNNADCYFLAHLFTAKLINLSLQLEEKDFNRAEIEIKELLHLLQDLRSNLYRSLYIQFENIEINKAKLQILRNIEIQLSAILKQ